MNQPYKNINPGDELDRVADSIANQTLPVDVVEKMKQQLGQSLARVSAKGMGVEARSGVLKWASAAACIAAVLLAVVLPSFMGQSNAFAKVQEAIEKATTIQLKQTSFVDGEKESYHAANLFIDERGRFRKEETGLRNRVSIIDPTRMEMMNIWPEVKQCRFHPIYDEKGFEKEVKTFLDLIRFADAESATLIGVEKEDGRDIAEYHLVVQLPFDGIASSLRVFVDLASDLPVKIVETFSDPEQVTVYEDIRFGEPIAPSLFAMDPPEGFEVFREERVDDTGLVLTSGVGMGEVEFGMSSKQVQQALGNPSVIAHPEHFHGGQSATRGDRACWFYPRGFRVCISKVHGVYELICGDIPEARPFEGMMAGEIRLGATREEIEKVYGTLYDLGDDDRMDYQPAKGFTTSFRFTEGRLSLIVMSKQIPEEDSPEEDTGKRNH